MQRRTFLRVLVASSITARLISSGTEAGASPRTLEATNTPDPCLVNIPRHGQVQKHPYVWYYRTEVHNPLNVPVRIVSFCCYAWRGKQWVAMPNILQRSLGTKEFVAWYSDGEVPHEGWIAPGKTAVCDPNFNWNKMGQGMRFKWVFLAEDTHGKRYQAEAQITCQSATGTKNVGRPATL